MTKKFSFEADRTSDLAALEVGDSLTFAPVKAQYLSEAAVSRLKTAGLLNGIVLSVHLTSDDSHRIEGSAVMVAGGVALCASHVFKADVDRLMAGELKVLCVGTSPHGNELWNIRHITLVPNTDICILSLSLVCGIPPDKTFHQASITTRTPRSGERLFVVAFKAEDEDCINWKPGQRIRTHILACAGRVTQHFLSGRGNMPPGPCIEVDFESWPGMSGGPVFDEDGWLVGVLSSSLSSGDNYAPSFVSLALSALAHPFKGGWMDPGPNVVHSLLSMTGTPCLIEKPEAVRERYLEDGRIAGYVYTTWQTR